jgi:hypothetical protein
MLHKVFVHALFYRTVSGYTCDGRMATAAAATTRSAPQFKLLSPSHGWIDCLIQKKRYVSLSKLSLPALYLCACEKNICNWCAMDEE